MQMTRPGTNASPKQDVSLEAATAQGGVLQIANSEIVRKAF